MTAPDPAAIRDAADRAEQLRPQLVEDAQRTRWHDEVLQKDDACRWGGVDTLSWQMHFDQAAELLSVLVPAARTAADLLDENKRLRELCGFLIDACATHRINVPIHSSLLDLAADVARPVTLPADAVAAAREEKA